MTPSRVIHTNTLEQIFTLHSKGTYMIKDKDIQMEKLS